MVLSVIIVNYNVRYFLQQCLHSVFASQCDAELEVFVVDNCSNDDSVAMIRQQFPQVHLIANHDNPGFARANNQAIRLCHGDYILLLNPDTIVQTDTFDRCIRFIQDTPNCGAVGAQMINGDGLYLKESKRGFPSPRTSFYKLSGLIHFFPNHRRIAAYYMGHLPDDETAPVDILPGAFMMMSRPALDTVGLLDESYFMYGEDIDFSWRFKLSGLQNYYLPSARIVHYKGECTQKGSMNYVYAFYNAMTIFVRHYFSSKSAKSFNILIHIAIWMRAILAWISRIISNLALPIIDIILSLTCFISVKHIWTLCASSSIHYYPDSYTTIVLPIYAILMVGMAFLGGGYDRPIRLNRIVKGFGAATCALLLFYSMLDESLRYSRAILLIGATLTTVVVTLFRYLLSAIGVKGYHIGPPPRLRYAIIGENEECQRVSTLLDRLGFVAKSIQHTQASHSLSLNNIDCIIFCSQDVSVSQIIDITQHYSGQHITFRIAPPWDDVLIGSNYTYSVNQIYQPIENIIDSTTCRRNKRILDIITAIGLIVAAPILWWVQQHKRDYFSHCWKVLTGQYSWVGYSQTDNWGTSPALPRLKPSIFATRDQLPHLQQPDLVKLDTEYAQNYSTTIDITILIRNITRI